ncbi:hypothetical protein C0J52_23000 [Blattella germanica]|nr:hypothetical protein C0J52_23000 [Blattella germanica]
MAPFHWMPDFRRLKFIKKGRIHSKEAMQKRAEEWIEKFQKHIQKVQNQALRELMDDRNSSQGVNGFGHQTVFDTVEVYRMIDDEINNLEMEQEFSSDEEEDHEEIDPSPIKLNVKFSDEQLRELGYDSNLSTDSESSNIISGTIQTISNESNDNDLIDVENIDVESIDNEFFSYRRCNEHMHSAPVGSTFKNRVKLSRRGVHRPKKAAIHGGPTGAFSIVLCASHAVKDEGEEFIFYGEGGRDREKKHVIAENKKINGFKIFEFSFVRCPNQRDPPWRLAVDLPMPWQPQLQPPNDKNETRSVTPVKYHSPLSEINDDASPPDLMRMGNLKQNPILYPLPPSLVPSLVINNGYIDVHKRPVVIVGRLDKSIVDRALKAPIKVSTVEHLLDISNVKKRRRKSNDDRSRKKPVKKPTEEQYKAKPKKEKPKTTSAKHSKTAQSKNTSKSVKENKNKVQKKNQQKISKGKTLKIKKNAVPRQMRGNISRPVVNGRKRVSNKNKTSELVDKFSKKQLNKVLTKRKEGHRKMKPVFDISNAVPKSSVSKRTTDTYSNGRRFFKTNNSARSKFSRTATESRDSIVGKSRKVNTLRRENCNVHNGNRTKVEQHGSSKVKLLEKKASEKIHSVVRRLQVSYFCADLNSAEPVSNQLLIEKARERIEKQNSLPEINKTVQSELSETSGEIFSTKKTDFGERSSMAHPQSSTVSQNNNTSKLYNTNFLKISLHTDETPHKSPALYSSRIKAENEKRKELVA